MDQPDMNNDDAMDMELALAHVDGDRQFLAELAEMFVQDYPHLLNDARKSIQQGDSAGLERAAHTLQGRLAFFGIKGVRRTALALEGMGQSGDLENAREALNVLESEMECIMPQFELLYRKR
jgi:HPt (histidine-containing phosphotransfer) domain-containing protein